MDIKSIAAALTFLGEARDSIKIFAKAVKTIAPEVSETAQIGLGEVILPILQELTTLASSDEGKDSLEAMSQLILSSKVAIAETTMTDKATEQLEIIAKAKAKKARIAYQAYRDVEFTQAEAFDLLMKDLETSASKQIAQALSGLKSQASSTVSNENKPAVSDQKA